MAGNIYLYLEVDGTNAAGNNFLQAGVKTVPLTVSLSNGKFSDKMITVAPNTTVTLFDSLASTSLTTFSFLYIQSDKDIMIELVTDQDNSIGTKYGTIKIAAGGTYILTSNVSYANYVANFGGGTLDVIDLIRARNISGVDTATVRIVLAN